MSMNWDAYLKEVLERAEKATDLYEIPDYGKNIWLDHRDKVLHTDDYNQLKTDLPRIAKYCLELREALECLAVPKIPLSETPWECQGMIQRARDILKKEIE